MSLTQWSQEPSNCAEGPSQQKGLTGEWHCGQRMLSTRATPWWDLTCHRTQARCRRAWRQGEHIPHAVAPAESEPPNCAPQRGHQEERKEKWHCWVSGGNQTGQEGTRAREKAEADGMLYDWTLPCPGPYPEVLMRLRELSVVD